MGRLAPKGGTLISAGPGRRTVKDSDPLEPVIPNIALPVTKKKEAKLAWFNDSSAGRLAELCNLEVTGCALVLLAHHLDLLAASRRVAAASRRVAVSFSFPDWLPQVVLLAQ